MTKQTFVIPRETFLEIGGFDEALSSRIHSELALRLNSACDIEAVPSITYRLWKHGGPQVSNNVRMRHRSFLYIWRKHHAAMRSRPWGAVRWAKAHAIRCRQEGQLMSALDAIFRAALLAPSIVASAFFTRLFGTRRRPRCK